MMQTTAAIVVFVRDPAGCTAFYRDTVTLPRDQPANQLKSTGIGCDVAAVP